MRGNSPSAPCAQIFAFVVSCGRAVASAGMSSAATMTCLGSTMLMQCASEGPVRLVLTSATTPPTLVMPSQIAMYSGRFGISRQTVSPLARPFARAQRAPEEGDVALQSRDQPHAFPRQAVGACFGAPFARALSRRADRVASVARKGYRVWLGPSSILLPPPLRGRDGERGGCLILGAATPLPVRACQVGKIRLGMREPTSPT